MAIIPMERTVSLDEPIKVEKLTGTLFTAENNAHKWFIRCTRSGNVVDVTGTVTARFKRQDGSAVFIQGGIEDGAACVVLTADCYNQPGGFQLTVFVTEGGSTLAIYSAVGVVTSTVDGDLIDGGRYIPTNADEIAEMIRNYTPPTMEGATEYLDGEPGMVPRPMAGDHVKFLRGDATWQTISKATARTSLDEGYGLVTDGKGTSIDANTPGRIDVNVSYDGTSAHATYEAIDTYIDNNDQVRAAMPIATTNQNGAIKLGSGNQSGAPLASDGNGAYVPNYSMYFDGSGNAGVLPLAGQDKYYAFFMGNGQWVNLFAFLAQEFDQTYTTAYQKGDIVKYLNNIYVMDTDMPAGAFPDFIFGDSPPEDWQYKGHKACLGDLIANLIRRVTALENAST